MYPIGEFSRITGLTVKTLRHYHKEGLLEPTWIDDQTGYRYYNATLVERAVVIRELRRMEFPIAAIGEILDLCQDDADLVEYLAGHREQIREKIRHQQGILRSLDEIITRQQEIKMNAQETTRQVEEKTVAPLLVAGVRMTGRYDECGKAYSRIGRAMGRFLSGKPLCLYYDDGFKETDADFEPCMPLRKEARAEGISVRTLPGGRCVSLVFQGPYGEASHHKAYQRIFDYIKENDLTPLLPSREIYIKGPGMIFRGNPKKYLTEIQVFVEWDEQ